MDDPPRSGTAGGCGAANAAGAPGLDDRAEHGRPEPRPGFGVAMGALAAVVGALLLGTLQGLAGQRGHELGYWALGVGLLVGAVLGLAGGRGRSVALWGAPLAIAGVALAQLVAAAMQVNPDAPAYSAADLLIDHAGSAVGYWRSEILGRNDVTFYLVAALEGYLVARRVAE